MRKFLSSLEKRKSNLEHKIPESFLRCQNSPNTILDSSFIGPILIFPEESVERIIILHSIIL